MSKILTLCLLALAGIGTGARPLLAQSLADVAKQEEERRKASPPPTKVYTNKDLGAVPAGALTSDAGKDAGKDQMDKDSAGKDAKNGKDAKDAKDGKDGKDAKDKPAQGQAYWSKRLKDLTIQAEQNHGYLDAMQTRLNSLDADFVNRDDPIQRAGIDRDRQKTRGEMARLTKAIQDGKKAVADLLEEARQAGVPPGWLR
jgi:hypothetical protein